MMTGHIALSTETIAEFCQRNHIRKLSLFGSVLRDDFRPGSDVDVLVEFEPGVPVGFFKLATIQDELSELVGREVDLNTPGFLSPHFRSDVVRTARVIYER
jgi:uncharacterized protein